MLNLGLQMRGKLNALLEQWPPGYVATLSWLAMMGIDRALARKYVASGWLVSLGQGAYARKGDRPGWSGALAALQQQNKSIWLGGVTALSLHGLIHYLPLGQESLTLYGRNKVSLPKWFRNHDWQINVQWQTTEMLSVSKDKVCEWPGIVERQVQGMTVLMSSPERAVLEMLHGVPSRWSFELAAETLQGATSLSPRKLQMLLELCSNIQVKRLLLFLGDYHGHAWFKRLDTSKIELGSGKRQVVKEGVYDPRWQITVPSHYQANKRSVL